MTCKASLSMLWPLSFYLARTMHVNMNINVRKYDMYIYNNIQFCNILHKTQIWKKTHIINTKRS